MAVLFTNVTIICFDCQAGVYIVHIYNYMVIIGCQLEWAYPLLTGLFSDILFFIVPDIGGEMFVLI